MNCATDILYDFPPDIKTRLRWILGPDAPFLKSDSHGFRHPTATVSDNQMKPSNLAGEFRRNNNNTNNKRDNCCKQLTHKLPFYLLTWVVWNPCRGCGLARSDSSTNPIQSVIWPQTFFGPLYEVFLFVVEVLPYVHRNRRLIADGSPGRPPRLSHSS